VHVSRPVIHQLPIGTSHGAGHLLRAVGDLVRVAAQQEVQVHDQQLCERLIAQSHGYDRCELGQMSRHRAQYAK